MNMELGTEATQFLFWEHLLQIFGIVSLQCRVYVVIKYLDNIQMFVFSFL
jgi:hypothetical protein